MKNEETFFGYLGRIEELQQAEFKE